MKIRCDYCGAMIDETSVRCPNCGAPLSGADRTSDEQPKTIEELKAWYEAHHLPPENITRFFIGKNIIEPKAFGIYQDSTGDYVVYKNKSTGERAIRYKGSDQAYAVNELYQRLKAEIVDQKAKPQFSVTEEGNKVIVTAKNVRAEVEKKTGRVEFFDAQGKQLLKETAQQGKTFERFTVPEREIGVGTLTEQEL